MKKVMKLVLLALSLSLPSVIYAADVTSILNCPDTAVAGGSITCKISTTNTIPMLGYEATISISSGLQYKSYTKTTGWDGTSSATKFLVYRGTGVTGTNQLGTYTFDVKSSATGNQTVSLREANGSNSNGDVLSATNMTETIRILSKADTLSSLTVSSGTLSPAFNPATTAYSFSTDDSSITINATANSGSVSGTGTKQLKYGLNTFNVVVTAEAGNKKTYVINITRNDYRNTDSKLKSLIISSGTITFKANTISYNVTVGSDVTSVTATGVANDSKATVSYIPSQTVKLDYGKPTSITVVVTAENTSKTLYNIIFTRTDNRNDNTNLKSLSIDKGTINFNKDILNYKVDVPNTITNIKILAATEDSKAMVSGVGDKELKEGSNTFKVIVTSEKKTTKTYTIVVNRKTKEEQKGASSDNNLSLLTIEGTDIVFSKDKLEYNVNVENSVSDLKINYQLSDSKAHVEIKGSTKLQVGINKIDIVVISESGEEKTYTLSVTRESNKNVEDNKFPLSTLIMIGVSDFELLIIILLICKNKKYRKIINNK